MPFLKHFGLRDYPFGLTPDPRMFYPAPESCALLEGLCFALSRGDGLLKVVGPVGSGKTLLCRLLLGRLSNDKVHTAYLNAPVALKAGDVAQKVAKEFGIKRTDHDDAAQKLTDFLLKSHAQGRSCVLVVDEAQALGAEGLEAIRLLSNLETETHKLLQIVLFGQSELDKLLARQDMRQIAQRINFAFETKAFAPETVADYVRYRLDCVAEKGARRGIMQEATLKKLARLSQGVPRVIHVLADKALIAAYADSAPQVTPAHLRQALRETPNLGIPWWRGFF